MACSEKGLKIRVIGVNDDLYSAAMTAALTTVSLEPAAMAHAAGHALLDEISGSLKISADIPIPVKLRVRASIGPASP
jgi:DNA-binding LacI/PurR family transcriptional regulator